MPQCIRCEGCRATLYEGAELKSPFEIIQFYEGKCPQCSRKLSPLPIEVEVKRIHQEA